MRLPIVPFIVAATLLTAVVYLFTATNPVRRTLDVPRLTRLADVDGVETEVAIAPDGNRYAVIASGELWLLNVSTGDRRQVTHTPEAESFPAWSPDGKRVTFTRGPDTFALNPDSNSVEMFRANATSLSWSLTSRTTFIRDRALWIANPNGLSEKQLVEADPDAQIVFRTPRFSPDSLQIAFIKTQWNIKGEVWTVDVLNGTPRNLVSDRAAEDPLDVGWIVEGRQLVYLTNRAGAYSLWRIDFAESTILPVTQPLVTVPLGRIGMGVWKDRIVLPRHFVDSNIVLSDGTPVVGTEKLEFEPAVSPDEKLLAFTVAEDNRFEIWTAGMDGADPKFRTLGREPRFAENGYQIVYSHSDLNGNDDIWKIDIRNGSADRVTDADEIDVTPDPSPDGRFIAFASARGGAISVWTVPTDGGNGCGLTKVDMLRGIRLTETRFCSGTSKPCGRWLPMEKIHARSTVDYQSQPGPYGPGTVRHSLLTVRSVRPPKSCFPFPIVPCGRGLTSFAMAGWLWHRSISAKPDCGR